MSAMGEVVLSEMAETLAENLGLSLAQSETVQVAIAFVSVETMKAGLDLVWPSLASGIAFSATGITLAIIRRQLKKLHEKIDIILEAVGLDAKEKFMEAMIAFEYGNMRQAFEDFRAASDLASSALNRTQDPNNTIVFVQMKIFALFMFKSYNEASQSFVPFAYQSEQQQMEIAINIQRNVEKTFDLVRNMPLAALVETMRLKIPQKWRKSKETALRKQAIVEILTGVYPILSMGLGWTHPKSTQVHFEADIVSIRIHARFVPESDQPLKIQIGTWLEPQNGTHFTPVCVTVRKYFIKKKSFLAIQSTEFTIENPNEPHEFTLEVFKGKLGAFRDPHTLLSSCCRIGHEASVGAFLLKNPGYDLNGTYYRGEGVLSSAITFQRTQILRLFIQYGVDLRRLDKIGDTPLHAAVRVDFSEGLQIMCDHLNDVDQANEVGISPLVLAVQMNRPSAVKVLLAQSEHSREAVLQAAQLGHILIVSAILSAIPDRVSATRASDGFNLLHIACQTNSYELAKILVKSPDKIKLGAARNSQGQTPKELAKSLGHGKILKLFNSGGVLSKLFGQK